MNKKILVLGIILIISFIGNIVSADDDIIDEPNNCSNNFFIGLSIGIIAGIIFSRVVIRKVIK